MPRFHSHNMAEGSDSSLDPNLVELRELRRSFSSLISLEHLELPEIPPLPAFLHRIEDLVDDGGSDDGVSPDREEDNQVSSENKEGRLDNERGSNEERRAGETTGPSTVISHGTDGLERCVQSAIVLWLGEQQHVNLDSLKTIFANFNLKDVLMNDPSFTALLTQQMNNVRVDVSRMLKTNPELRLEELKEYYSPICWSSTKRLEFLCRLSDKLLLKAKAPNQQDELKGLLSEELESKKPLIFYGKWIDKIDHKFRPHRQYDYESVGGLLRFVRNQWRHLPDGFEEFLGFGSGEHFYDYFDARFPKLFMLSYGAASQVCREERWFEEFR